MRQALWCKDASLEAAVTGRFDSRKLLAVLDSAPGCGTLRDLSTQSARYRLSQRRTVSSLPRRIR